MPTGPPVAAAFLLCRERLSCFTRDRGRGCPSSAGRGQEEHSDESSLNSPFTRHSTQCQPEMLLLSSSRSRAGPTAGLHQPEADMTVFPQQHSRRFAVTQASEQHEERRHTLFPHTSRELTFFSHCSCYSLAGQSILCHSLQKSLVCSALHAWWHASHAWRQRFSPPEHSFLSHVRGED